MPFLILLVVSFLQANVPLKPSADFVVKVDYKFKTRPGSTTAYNANGDSMKDQTAILPYLIVNLKLLKLDSGEVKIRIDSDKGQTIFNRKVSSQDSFVIDYGFTADAKDRVTAHAYTVLFLTDKKVAVSSITIDIDEEGNFFVNKERRGKF